MRNHGGCWTGGQVPCPTSCVPKGCPSPEGQASSCSPGRMGMSQLTQPTWKTSLNLRPGMEVCPARPSHQPLQLDALSFCYQEF